MPRKQKASGRSGKPRRSRRYSQARKGTLQARKGTSKNNKKKPGQGELKRRVKRAEAALKREEKHRKAIDNIHEQQMGQIQSQHQRDLDTLQHQHDQHVRALEQAYQQRIMEIEQESISQMTSAREDLEGRDEEELNRVLDAFEKDKQEDLAALKHKYETQKAAMEKEHAETLEKLHEAQDRLAVTQAKLVAVKQEYETNLDDAKKALMVSKEHVQANYEVISGLHDDKKALQEQLAKNREAQKTLQAKLRASRDESARLEAELKASQIDNRDYLERTQQLHAERDNYERQLSQHRDEANGMQVQMKQYQLAIGDATTAMQQEKDKHQQLRYDYEQHVNRMTALDEALQECNNKNVTAEDVIERMNARLTELQQHSENMLDDMRALEAKNQKYEDELAVEQRRTEKMAQSLQMDKRELQELVANTEKKQQATYTLLETCQAKGGQCLQNLNRQDEYIAKLEKQVKIYLAQLEDQEGIAQKADQLEQEVVVTTQEAQKMSVAMEELEAQNQELRAQIKDFETQKTLDQQLLKKHVELQQKHAKTIKWVQEMQVHHAKLHNQQEALEQQLAQANQAVASHQVVVEETAARMRDSEAREGELVVKVERCMYPGEKERLEAQLVTVLEDREQLRGAMDSVVVKHEQLIKHVQTLQAENENLKVLAARSELDVAQMQQVVEQGAELNVELTRAKTVLRKKEKQLTLFAQQVDMLVRRIAVLENQENKLREQLGYSATPEEIGRVNDQLTACRLERKEQVVKFDTLQAAMQQLQEQNQVNEAKVGNLVTILQEGERLKAQLLQEKDEKAKLQTALDECSKNGQLTADELKAQIDLVENKYQENLVTHEKMMQESNARIQALEAQLKEMAEADRQMSLQMKQQKYQTQAPAPKTEVHAVEAAAIDRQIKELQVQVAALTKERAQLTNSPEVAVRMANLPAANKLQQMKLRQMDLVRARERTVLNMRQRTNDEMTQALLAAQKGELRQQDLYGVLDGIRQRGAAREQQALTDMLELRAVNQRLLTEYRSARAAQWQMLNQANRAQRAAILRSAAPGTNLANLKRQAQQYQALMGAQQNYITSQRRDVEAKLQTQQAYIQQLQRQLPRMQQIETNIRQNIKRWPDLKPLQQQIQQERKFTIASIRDQIGKAEGYVRTRSALERQLQANDAAVRGMIAQVDDYLKNPSEPTRNGLTEFARLGPTQIAQEMKRQAALRDRSNVRTTFVVQPRAARLGQPGKELMVDDATGEVQIKRPSASDRDEPNRYFASDVAVNEPPRRTFAPLVARATSQVKQGASLIAVTYSFLPATTLDTQGRSLKYLVFLHALQELFPKIQTLSPNGTLNIQLMRITSNEGRQDLINRSHQVPPGCTYRTCSAVMQTVDNVKSAADIIDALNTEDFNAADAAQNHLVMTLSVPENTSRIHIADVLFLPRSPGASPVPPNVEIKLLDSSWITYLSDVLQNRSTKIDMFFNLLPHKAGDNQTSTANDRLLQVSARLQEFLDRLTADRS